MRKLVQRYRQEFILKNELLSELHGEIMYLLDHNIKNNLQGLFNEIIELPHEEGTQPEVESKNINLLIRYYEDEGFKMTSIEHIDPLSLKFKINISL